MKKFFSLHRFVPAHIKWLSVIGVTLGIFVAATYPARAGIYYTTMYPSVTQAPVGATFTVDVKTKLVIDTAATGYLKGAITYPANLLQLDKVIVGDYPEVTITTSNGLIYVSSPDKGSGHGYGGYYTIITATFKALAPGTATISATNGTANGVLIVNGTNHTVNTGSVSIVGCAAGYTGTYPNCTAPTTTGTTTTVAPTNTVQAPAPTTTATGSTPSSINTTTTSTNTPMNQPASTSATVSSNPPAPQLNNDSSAAANLEGCVSSTLGGVAYADRVSKQIRFTYDELAKVQHCFAESHAVIPDSLAPVVASKPKVKELPVKQEAKVEKFEKITKNGSEAIKLSGKAKPNQIVVIYVFSDPMVLVAKADKDGNWTYDLEDPLEPGKHEAYVTVEGTGQPAVRSDGFGFAIAAAPKTALNPLGMSLNLQNADSSKNLYGYYIAGTVVAVVIALLVSMRIVRQRSHQKGDDSQANPPSGTTGPVVGGGF